MACSSSMVCSSCSTISGASITDGMARLLLAGYVLGEGGAASCGAVSTQVLAQRRGRNSPQSQLIISAKNIRHDPAKAKLIILMSDSKNSNDLEGTQSIVDLTSA